ncbi:hypothetical protein [Algibacter pectinivorans]|uniref:YhhN-like protein n=1 Tax=Algibacter pectinivorans TaxID=870482 RepID=A0A1I1S0M4_9FLAO|nr:hypothetical protein [Algibacter pectinivorans]SFD39862.1 hypothetical protein SAMN04487987_11254 [Algibacter pectinivorans]
MKIKPGFYDLLFYIAFVVCIIFSITMERAALLYISPLVVVTILLKYISVTKKKADPLFILALIALFGVNFFSFYGFNSYFKILTLLTCAYLICYCLILKKYISKAKYSISVSVSIGVLLVVYSIYSIVVLLVDYIPKSNLIYMILCACCLLIYAAVVAKIYVKNNYQHGTVLLGSGISSIFHIGLSPINEYFYYNKTFTVIIIICHFISIYLFMVFITKTKPVNSQGNYS